MNGRQENTFKTENAIILKLKKHPVIISDYYYSLTEKTAQTKKVYIDHIIEYFSYLKTNRFNVDSVSSFKRIKKADIDAYIAFSRYSKRNGVVRENGVSIIRSRIYALKSFFDYLVDNDYIDINPCDKVKLPSINKDISVTYLTEEEISVVKQRICEQDKYWKRDLAIFVLGVRTGLRITSIREINIEDIDFDEKCITVTEKGNKQRVVYFGDDTKRILNDWIGVRPKSNTNALFVSNRGNRISYTIPKRILDMYANDFNKRITCHKMRSTCATNTYNKTGDIYLTADVLGHKNLSNTRRYTNISANNRKKAAAILDEL
mgnify:CR=1 FL=1